MAVTRWGAIQFRYMGLCWLVRWFLELGYIGAANMEHFGDLLLITLIYATFISVSLIHIIAGVRGGRSLIDAPTVPRGPSHGHCLWRS